MTLRVLAARLIGLTRRHDSEGALAKEIASHIALMEADLRRQGLSEEEARFAALRAFGGVEQAKERYRDQRTFIWFEQLWQDFRHVGRSLRKSPGFLSLAVVSIALGVGVNTAIFTLVNGVLLKRLGMPEADRVVQLQAKEKFFASDAFSYPQYNELRRQTSVFSETTAFSDGGAVLNAGGGPSKIALEFVDGNYFRFFHASPLLGRLIDEEDDRVENAHPLCVLSYTAWKSRFGGDVGVLGRIIRINTSPFQIVGVAAPGFAGAELQSRFDIWVPTAMSQPLVWNKRDNPHVIWLSVLAKLQPGLTLKIAQTRLSVLTQGINEVLPKSRANADAIFSCIDASKGFDNARTHLRQPLLILMSAVGLVLLIACANLTNLLLARGMERSREFTVKLSLGISQARLLRQLLSESLLLTLAGGVLAVAGARGLVAALLFLFNAGGEQNLSVAMDSTVLAFTFGVCASMAILIGLYPAWSAARTNAAIAFKGSGTGPQKRFIRRTMIVVQVGLTVVLLFGASIFSHSLRNLQTIDLGYDIEHVAIVNIVYRGKEPLVGSPALEGMLRRTQQLQGVQSAALANPSMLSGESMTSDLIAHDSSGGADRRADNTYFVFASPGHFATLRMRLQRGRDFNDRDRAKSAPVAIINQRLADLLWPGQNPVGKRLKGCWNGTEPEVIGVTGNSKYTDVREGLKPIVYQPLAQMPVLSASLEVRSPRPLAWTEHQIRKIVGSSEHGFEVGDVSTMILLRDHVIAQDRLLTFLSLLFGGLGITLALVGIYGLISYSVTRRTREVGIRMSIGAERAAVLILFLREVLILVGLGVAIGLPLALAISRPLRGFLFDVRTTDPFGITLTLFLMLIGGVAAAFFPARRATRIDPAQALRYE